MPYISPEKRNELGGGRAWSGKDDDPHNGGPCDCNWDDPKSIPRGAAWLRHRVLPTPDQSRYGKATTDPPAYNTDGTIRRTVPT